MRDVLERTRGQSENDIAKALYDAYPFGLRQYHPYKIWLDEIKRQRGTKAKHTPCACSHAHGSHRGKCHAADCSCDEYRPGNPNQVELFSQPSAGSGGKPAGREGGDPPTPGQQLHRRLPDDDDS